MTPNCTSNVMSLVCNSWYESVIFFQSNIFLFLPPSFLCPNPTQHRFSAKVSDMLRSGRNIRSIVSFTLTSINIYCTMLNVHLSLSHMISKTDVQNQGHHLTHICHLPAVGALFLFTFDALAAFSVRNIGGFGISVLVRNHYPLPLSLLLFWM
jgi:hypothetical protein